MSRISRVVAVASAAAFAGCGAFGSQSDDSEANQGPSYTIPAGALSNVLSQAGEGERSFLDDGVLTFEEYERAVLNLVACYEGAGITVTNLALNRRNQYSFDTAAPAADGREAWNAAQSCRSVHLKEVARLWARHTAPSQSELDEVVAEVRACLLDLGADIPRTASRDDIFQYFIQGGADMWGPEGDCVEHTEARMGFGSVIGITRVSPPVP